MAIHQLKFGQFGYRGNPAERVILPHLGVGDNQNGCFLVEGPQARALQIQASDGQGWEHVSVSVARRPDRTPTWGEMCFAKDLFWNAEATVIQLHPPRSKYRNHHPGCLHLWRPIGVVLPMPDPSMIGPPGPPELGR